MTGDTWVELRLAEFVSLQRGHDLPEQLRGPGLVPVLGSFGVTGTHDEAIAPGPGLTIGRSGASMGVVSYSAEPYWPLNTVLYVTDFQGNDPRFVYYLLRTLDFRAYNSGSAQPSLNRNFIASLLIKSPRPSEQRAIARLLGALDDNIELNRRMNEALEMLVSQMVLNEASTTIALSGVADNVREVVDPGDMHPATPYIALEHMPRQSIALADWGRADSATSAKTRFRSGDILFGKLRPYFHKVGVAPCGGVCSTDILVIRPKSPTFRALTVAVASSSAFVAHATATSTGTKMPRASWRDLADYEFRAPDRARLAELNESVDPLLARINANVHKSRTLAALRDALLPKLISGEIRIRAAERGA